MANNYLQFSFCVALKPESVPAVASMLKLLETDEPLWDESLAQVGITSNEWDFLVEEETSGNSYNLENTELWIHGDECGNVESAAVIVHGLLTSHCLVDTTTHVLFTWAATCSKMLVAEFCGGAVLITPHSIHYQDCAETWADKVLTQEFGEAQ